MKSSKHFNAEEWGAEKAAYPFKTLQRACDDPEKNFARVRNRDLWWKLEQKREEQQRARTAGAVDVIDEGKGVKRKPRLESFSQVPII